MSLMPTLHISFEQRPEMVPKALRYFDHRLHFRATGRSSRAVPIQRSSDLVQGPPNQPELRDRAPQLGELLLWEWSERSQVSSNQDRNIGCGGNTASGRALVQEQA